MKKVLKVMDSSGDTQVTFDTETDAKDATKGTTEAKALFDRLIGKGAAVFAVNRGDSQSDKRITNFNDLEAENVVVPLIIGG